MNGRWLDVLRCPACQSGLEISDSLRCSSCQAIYPITRSVPRFIPESNYADNFGLQWNQFRTTQLDSHSGLPISRERFFRSTGWNPEELNGKRVLDIGCGAGRFAEIALSCGAEVAAVDYSSAIDACQANLGGDRRLQAIQADIYQLPFARASFDYIYCLGVLQHTPDVEKAFCLLPGYLKTGGKLAVDVYPKLARNSLWSKYWFRPFTRNMDTGKLFGLVRRAVPPLLALSRAVSRIPLVGRQLRYAIPVVNYRGVYPLSEEQQLEWAVLDTFDMFSPTYDQPQSAETMTAWARKAGLRECQVFRSGFIICRGLR